VLKKEKKHCSKKNNLLPEFNTIVQMAKIRAIWSPCPASHGALDYWTVSCSLAENKAKTKQKNEALKNNLKATALLRRLDGYGIGT
jgi:hypothetical protein